MVAKACWFGVLIGAIGPSQALAGEFWWGVGADGGAMVRGAAGTVDVTPLVSQAEFDLRYATGPIFLQLDLDIHVDPADVEGLPAFPLPPEEAFVQVGRDRYQVRLGVSNPNMGLQAWDAWANYFPVYGQTFALQPGQVVGAQPRMVFDDGSMVAVWGGYDLGWLAPVVGANVATEQASWSTWSGVAAWPTLGYYAVFPAFEVYPTDWLWLTVDGMAGVAGGGFGGGQLVANIVPEAVVHPAVRVEWFLDPNLAVSSNLGLAQPADWSVGASGSTTLADWLTIELEARADSFGGTISPAGIVYLGVHRPEPDDDFATSVVEVAE